MTGQFYRLAAILAIPVRIHDAIRRAIQWVKDKAAQIVKGVKSHGR